MQRAIFRLASAGLLGLVLAGCSSTPSETHYPTPSSDKGLTGDVVEQQWNLLLVGTDERLSMPETPHFRIGRDGKVSGSDGCNTFTGTASLGDSQRIEISKLASTRMACPKQADAQRVTGMLENAYRYLIDHDRLVLFGPDSRVLGGWREAK